MMSDYLYSPAEQAELDQVNSKLRELVDVDRRVISRKETISYILFNSARGFNIDGHKDLFTDSILHIGFNLQSLNNTIGSFWDVIDDFFVAFVVEKTRTRWGKFIPYIFLGGIPFALLSAMWWLIPMFFSPEQLADTNNIPKFVLSMVLGMLIELVGNFRDVAIGGFISTITPYASDRRRLLAISSYVDIIASRIPDLVIEFTLDFIKNGLVKISSGGTEAMIKKSLMIVGPSTALLGGVFIAWYSTVAKERVHQKIEKPKILESLKIVFTNKPVLVYMLSNALGTFGTGLSTNDYYRQVLNMTTFETIAGIPSFFFQPIGFSKYNPMAERYSTKSLYMISQVFAKSFYIPLWFYGRFLHTKSGKMFFQDRIAMLPVTAVWECIYATWWGIKSISATEISNECNDYIEWVCGYRNEATLSVASTFICKIPGRINGIVRPQLRKWINYDQTAYTEGREQSIQAQKWIFAMATIIPAILVLSSMIPMFWYDINKEKRDRMYRELNERRTLLAKKISLEADETIILGE